MCHLGLEGHVNQRLGTAGWWCHSPVPFTPVIMSCPLMTAFHADLRTRVRILKFSKSVLTNLGPLEPLLGISEKDSLSFLNTHLDQ